MNERASAAAELDAGDPLGKFPGKFVGSDDPALVAYLDGNSLGRPTRATADRLSTFVTDDWGGRLIRGWDESWFDLPITLGDRLARVVLGAGPGQTVVGDSTTVLLYKLVVGALALQPGRTEIVVDRDNFPTDRYVVETVAAERGLTVRWLEPAFDAGVSVEDVARVVSERTAVVLLSHVAYRSGYLADIEPIAAAIRDVGALLVLDLCHSVGALPLELDSWRVDFAAGCTYKYLNGGPGSPAFGYVASRHIDGFHQPIAGWMGRAEPFEMAQGYRPAPGIRRLLSGTPAVLAMGPMCDMLDLIEQAGLPAIRAKSIALTQFALELVDEWLVPLGVTVSSPRAADRRGGHVTVDHPRFRDITATLWQRGVIPDFRRPDGIRLGLSPLSTTFREVHDCVAAVRDELSRS